MRAGEKNCDTKIETRLIDEKFPSVMGECVINRVCLFATGLKKAKAEGQKVICL